jgi:hypothetical protein
MDDWYDSLEAARAQLGRINELAGRLGFHHVDIPSEFGAGSAVASSEHDFVVLSIGAGGDNNVNLVSGVLADVATNRAFVLDLCNNWTRDNYATPVFLHEADAGADILLGLAFPVQLFLDVPPYLAALFGALPDAARRCRKELLDGGIRGRPHHWDMDDVNGLHTRSLF